MKSNFGRISIQATVGLLIELEFPQRYGKSLELAGRFVSHGTSLGVIEAALRWAIFIVYACDREDIKPRSIDRIGQSAGKFFQVV